MQSKKLTGNGLWESSRMMLPEHKVRILEHMRRENAKTKPILDVDAVEDIERVISVSLAERTPITLTLFDRYEDLRVIGVVERIDALGRRIMVSGEWFRMADVIGAE